MGEQELAEWASTARDIGKERQRHIDELMKRK
jgi:hypothetical protein